MSHDLHDIEPTARALVADGKGILVADETVPTLTKRFDALGIPSTEQRRCTYREMLFTAPDAARFISGVIMHDETIRQKSSAGTPLVQLLSSQGIVPGIKVDAGAKPPRGLERRDGHRGARRSAGPPDRIPEHGGPLREMASGHPHRRRAADPRPRGRRPRARAVRMACCGDVPTLETLAAVDLLRRHAPDLKIRVINVVNLMKLQPSSEHPHGLSDWDFDALFTTDKPIIFAFHGYPWLIHRLTYRRTGHGNLHVRGYKEEGTTSTPFDMCVLNDVDRFHLVSDVIDRVPKLGARAAYAKQAIRDKLIEHKEYIARHGEDMPDITDWKWGQRMTVGAARSTEADNV
jgi:XFP C-terminal domain/Fructose-bisphosphate aldolase class-I